MEFSFEVDPDLDLAIGIESVIEFSEDSEDAEILDLSGYDPLIPTGAKPGSEDKVKMLAARYSAGMPLWHDEDCYDHGPVNGLLDGEAESEDDYDVDALEDEDEEV